MSKPAIRGANTRSQHKAAGLLALALLASPALGQSASDFRLPPASPTATTRAPGPVDSDAPVVRSRPSNAPAPAPTATAAPSAAPTSPAPAPSARPTQVAPRSIAAPAARPAGTVTTPAAPASASPQPSLSPAPAPVISEAAAVVSSEPMSAPPSLTAKMAAIPWWWFAAAFAVLGAGLAVWLLRRRKAMSFEEYDQEELSAAEVPLAPTPPLRAQPPAPTRAAASPPPPAAAVDPAAKGPVNVAFEAGKMSATLINTALAYRLVIQNRTDQPLAGLIIAGDMIAAHASLPVEKQLATDGQPLELRHEIAHLGPGETIELTGELRLPLSSINPIRSGTSLLYIPLARLRIEADGESMLAAWVIGEAPQKAGGGLQPFRLDLGPRVYADVSQRRIELAA